MSPAIHNAAYEYLGLDFVYVASRVEDVKSALGGVRALNNFRGLSVTIPHKIETMKYVDVISEEDRAIGSINTVIHEKDSLIGIGTDGPGAMKALLDNGVDIEGRCILMLGAGGASRAISFTLAMKAKPAEIMLLDINPQFLAFLRNDLVSSVKIPVMAELITPKSLCDTMKKADIIINCTSVGMHPNEEKSIVPPELLRSGQTVFDIVYTPLETRLLKDAGEMGLKVISGDQLFINQAALQFEHFTGVSAPVEVMRKVLIERLKA